MFKGSFLRNPLKEAQKDPGNKLLKEPVKKPLWARLKKPLKIVPKGPSVYCTYFGPKSTSIETH